MSMSFLPIIIYLVGVLAWAAWISPRMRRLIDPKAAEGWHTVPRDVAAGSLWPAWATVYIAALVADAVLTVPVGLRIVRIKRAARISEMQARTVRRHIRALRVQNNALIMENHCIRRQIDLIAGQRSLLKQKTATLERYGDELEALTNLRKRSAS